MPWFKILARFRPSANYKIILKLVSHGAVTTYYYELVRSDNELP